MHVPKCGGASLRVALGQMPGCYAEPLYFDRAHFGSPRLIDGIPAPTRDDIATTDDVAAIVRSHELVIGHYCTETLVAAGCARLAVQVREPRARLLSLYRYWQNYTPSQRAEWGLWGSELVAKTGAPFNEFLAAPETRPATDNQIARQVLSYGRKPASTFGRRRLLSRFRHDAAGRFSIVEWSSRSEQFFARLCELLGVSSAPTVGWANVSEVTHGEQVIDAVTRRHLERLTTFDQLLLDQLAADGVLARRTQADLDAEFETTAQRLRFRLG
ncbi:MAG: hypothetical protein ACLPVF_08555 [Acidimicrobiales bacterium]